MSSAVSGNTDYVITNDKSANSSKLKAAKENNIPILLKQEFDSKFNIKLVDI